MSGGRQSSSEVAHEAEDTRAHLASTLEQLRTNLQPANVMDEVVSNAKLGAASVADNLAGIARQHPIPSMLVAAGSALLMRVFSGRRSPGPDGEGPGTAGSGPPMLRDPSGFRPAPGRGGSTVDLPGGSSSDSSSLRRQASEAAATASQRAGEAMRSMSHYLPPGGERVRSRLSTLLDEQPLILGAIGLAVGAAIGAALPITETEDHLMGSTAHRLRDQATDAARHEVDEMRAAAGQAIDNVRQSAADNLRTVVGKAGGAFGTDPRDV